MVVIWYKRLAPSPVGESASVVLRFACLFRRLVCGSFSGNLGSSLDSLNSDSGVFCCSVNSFLHSNLYDGFQLLQFQNQLFRQSCCRKIRVLR